MPVSRTGPADAIAARRTRVAELIRQHCTQRQIARELAVSNGTVAKDTKAVRKEWAERRDQERTAWVAEELHRLSVAENAIWLQIKAGNLFAIDRLLAIMERRAHYLGLDEPLRVNLERELTDYARTRAAIYGLDEAEALTAVERILKAARV